LKKPYDGLPIADNDGDDPDLIQVPPAAPAPLDPEIVRRIAERVVSDVADMPRFSPEDLPDMMLVTADELRDFVEDAVREFLGAVQAERPRETCTNCGSSTHDECGDDWISVHSRPDPLRIALEQIVAELKPPAIQYKFAAYWKGRAEKMAAIAQAALNRSTEP